MIINNIIFNCELIDILTELKAQLTANNIQLLSSISDSGNDIMISCPYHKNGQERKPSAGIRKSDGKFHCFACHETHELYEVVSHCFCHYDDILGTFGWSWLLKNFATVSIENRKDISLDFARNPQNQIENNYVSEEELDRYRYFHPYWKKRGITDESIIELFDLGYDSETDSITMPVRDIKGNVLFIARRSVKTKFFSYPKLSHKPVYGLYELEHSCKDRLNEVFITESMIDCILLWQAGFYTVALNGTGSELQYKQLNELRCRKYILATDNDKAGSEARIKLKRRIKNKMITEIIFPKGIKDVGECSQEQINNIKDWEVF